MKKVSHHMLVWVGLILTLSLILNPVASYADTSDWVQVERFKKLEKQAKAGKVLAMYDLAHAYERGKGTDINLDKAVHWYQQASEAGFASAKARLGILYFEGRGVPQDHKKAHQLLSAAALENIPSAQYQLALMYEWGTVVEQDREKALYWYNKAAKAGDYRSQEKVKQLSSKTNAPPPSRNGQKTAGKPVSGNSKPVSPRPSKISGLLKHQWTKNNRPVGYLPSAISECTPIGDTALACVSRKLKRKTRDEIIIYDVEANLSHFKNQEFTIEYVNTIVEVTAIEKVADAMDETEEDTVSSTGRIKAGQKSPAHKLECRFLNNKHVRCTRDGTRSYDFHG